MAADREHHDVLIVGAGFSGLYLLHRLRQRGLQAHLVDRAPSVGGTWYWNRYPGCRCDVESMTYSYSFDEELEQEWSWSTRYAGQPEILRYLNHVADRFDLRRDIQLETSVTAAQWDEDASLWRVITNHGEVTARWFVMATGCLSVPNPPRFPGLDSFDGAWYHTTAWPEDGVDFTGQRVGIIGTGSTAIQTIPQVAAQAEHLTVFQRTPNFSIPAWNGPMDPAAEAARKSIYRETRATARRGPTGDIWPASTSKALAVSAEEREAEYERRWHQGSFSFLSAFDDITTDEAANETAAEFVRNKIRATVTDPAVAELLCPYDHPLGTKRLCVDTDYYATYNRPNVTLVDIKDAPIEEITEAGLITGGTEYAFDSLIFATGFDSMTGALLAVDIRGRNDQSLRDLWANGPHSYLGLTVHGFPNLFTMTGPGSPSVLSNMMTAIEQHVEWVDECIGHLTDQHQTTIEATADAQANWDQLVHDEAYATLYPRAASWYMGANIPGKPRVFLPYIGGVGKYTEICADVASNDYRGFVVA
jgi:cyclohexanone monooxygenase